jgi:hypothetical protein
MGQSESKDASLAVIQGIVYSAAMKGEKFGTYVRNTYGITCFSCKKPGHLSKDCKNPSGNKKSLSPGICPGCSGENLGGMIAGQSPIKTGLSSLKKRVRQKTNGAVS